MTSLGQFGTLRPPADDVTFDYFGQTLRVDPDLSDLAMVDFVEQAATLEATDGAAALAAVKGMLRSLVHGEDFDTFWKLARENRQQIEDMSELAQAILVAVTERPTERPSGSSDGQPSTVASSTAGSSSPVTRLESQGRPELALVVKQTQEHLAG